MARAVNIGGAPRHIGDFNARKAKLAGAAVKRLTAKAPGVATRIAQFKVEYREEHTTIITQDQALHPLYRDMFLDVSAEDWARAGGQIRLPRDPSTEEIITYAFPELFDLAETEVLDLLALCVIPNADLSAARKTSEQAVSNLISETRENLLDDALVGELVDLVDAVVTELKEELASRGPVLDRLRGLWARAQRQTPEEEEAPAQTEPTAETEAETPTPVEEPSGTPPGSPDVSPIPTASTTRKLSSSGDSDGRSDGTKTPSLIESEPVLSTASPSS